MSILFGHPTGSPNSHNAALAHLEAGRLECFCVSWMPSLSTLWLLDWIHPIRASAQRLSRRYFAPLGKAPKIQGRAGEVRRLLIRAAGGDHDYLSHQANEWLMRTMSRECRRPRVSAVHAYEDCSLWQFAEAKRLGKACIYDMPIGYYSAWKETEAQLVRRYADWLPIRALPFNRQEALERKREEMNLADLVLVPSSFAEATIRRFHPYKVLALAPYGVDLEFWAPAEKKQRTGPLRFIYAGQVSLRKGIPILLEAWKNAALRDARLELVGPWQLADSKRSPLPRGVIWGPPCSAQALRDKYRSADVFVFPSMFEGLGLVLLEAMACALPAIASEATGAGPELITETCGGLVPAGNVDALVEILRWFECNRGKLPDMGRAARAQAARCSWERYRRCVSKSVTPFV